MTVLEDSVDDVYIPKSDLGASAKPRGAFPPECSAETGAPAIRSRILPAALCLFESWGVSWWFCCWWWFVFVALLDLEQSCASFRITRQSCRLTRYNGWIREFGFLPSLRACCEKGGNDGDIGEANEG